MSRHFENEIKSLKDKIVRMGVYAQEALDKALKALYTRNSELADQVVEEEDRINKLELDIDRDAHNISALQQPVAHDLRLLVTVLKINTDLERIGDHAVNIAERVVFLNEEPPLESNLHLKEMTKAVQEMLRDAMAAFISEDVTMARQILKRDDVVDNYNHQIYAYIGELIEKDPIITKTGMNMVMISHNLERIADLSNNIAENVIYLKQGKDVRHRIEF